MRYLGPGLFRLVLALIVVLHHSSPIRLGTWAVGLFFCLSGYWVTEMWYRRYRMLDRPYVEFIISRWWRLAPVLCLTTLIGALLIARGIDPADASPIHDWRWWATQPLIIGSTWSGRILPPAWSLDVEMQFYLLAPILIALAVRSSAVARGVALLAMLTWCWTAMARDRAGEAARLDVWLGLFAIGILSSVTQWRPSKRLISATAAATAITLLAVAAIPMTRPWLWLPGASHESLAGRLPATLTLATILMAVPSAIGTTRVRSSHFDRMLGDLSYPLYLFHWWPRDWYYLHEPARMPLHLSLAFFGANVGSAICGAVLILLLVDRPVQVLRARWVGQRSQESTEPDKGGDACAFAGTA